MGRLVIWSLVLVAWSSKALTESVNKSKRGVIDSNHGYYQPDKFPQYYQSLATSSIAVQEPDATKQQGPFVVEYQPQAQQTVVPPPYQQYQTVHPVPQPQVNLLPAQHQPGFIGQPQTSQYTVHHPAAQNNPFAYTGVYAPVQQLQPSANPDATRYFQGNNGKLIAAPIKPTLVQTQIYHPYRPLQPQQSFIPFAKLAVPTPPRIYTQFQPMTTTQKIVQHPKPKPKPVEEKEEERVEDDDDQSRYVEDDEDDYRPSKYRHNDDDHESYEDDDHDDYRESSYKYSESRPGYSKLSKFSSRYPKENQYKSKYGSKPHYKTGLDYRKPNVEYKTYRYTRKSKNPYHKEHIEGKGSEMTPVIHHNQNLMKEQWIVTTKSSSTTK